MSINIKWNKSDLKSLKIAKKAMKKDSNLKSKLQLHVVSLVPVVSLVLVMTFFCVLVLCACAHITFLVLSWLITNCRIPTNHSYTHTHTLIHSYTYTPHTPHTRIIN